MKMKRASVAAVLLAFLFLQGCGKSPVVQPERELDYKPIKETAIDLGGGVELELVWIERGSFQMGSDGGRYDEKPAHLVELDGFWMGKYEVTQEQFEELMGNNPSYFEGLKNPVEQLTWDDATEFCAKLSEKTAQTFALPTEAQWEYAFRAGTTSAYPLGKKFKRGVCNVENDVGSSEDKNVSTFRKRGLPTGGTMPVGTFEVNFWGLYDMDGNVWEWCQDWYDSDFYSRNGSRQKNPANSQTAQNRVVRGGSWSYNSAHCLSASRGKYHPDVAQHSGGFRVVRKLK